MARLNSGRFAGGRFAAGRFSGGRFGTETDPSAAIAALFGPGDGGVYLDPADLTTLFQDAAGAMPVTEAGHPVGRINGVLGVGQYASQSTGESRPTYQTGGGLSWLALDGVDDTLSTPSSLTLRRGITMVIALRYGSGGASAGYTAVSGLEGGSTDYARIGIRTGIASVNVTTRGGAIGVGLASGPTASAGPDTPLVLSMVFGLSTQDLRVNGAAATPAAHTWADGQSVAAAFRTGHPVFDVPRRLYFAFCIDRVLSAPELALVEQMAAQRSGAVLGA